MQILKKHGRDFVYICLHYSFNKLLKQILKLMKYQTGKSKISIISIVLLLALSLTMGCDKNNDNPDPEPEEYKSYISHTLVRSYSSESIKTLFQTLETVYPEVATLSALIEYDVNVYNVVYKTLFQGEEIEVSGLISIPDTDGGSFPIVSFQNGTNTSHADAPTKNLNSTIFKYLHSMASTGNIMLLPDYIGFGKSEQFVHPYLHKESTVAVIENFIIAAKEMIAADLIKTDWNTNLYLMGYSQGGWSTLCTHNDIDNTTDLDFNITASACGAGPYDLSIVQNYMIEGITYPQPVYMAYSIISYNELGLITNPLTDYFNEPYATPLPSYFEGQYNNSQINELLNDTVAVLLTDSFLNGMNTDSKYEDLRNAMNSNSISGWNTSQPIRLYHGTSDNYVPPTTSEQVFQEFVNAGATDNVSYIPLPGLNHETGAVPMILDALLWFADMEDGSEANNYKDNYIKIDASKPQMLIE